MSSLCGLNRCISSFRWIFEVDLLIIFLSQVLYLYQLLRILLWRVFLSYKYRCRCGYRLECWYGCASVSGNQAVGDASSKDHL
jgi:hypothetical protein